MKCGVGEKIIFARYTRCRFARAFRTRRAADRTIDKRRPINFRTSSSRSKINYVGSVNYFTWNARRSYRDVLYYFSVWYRAKIIRNVKISKVRTHARAHTHAHIMAGPNTGIGQILKLWGPTNKTFFFCLSRLLREMQPGDKVR